MDANVLAFRFMIDPSIDPDVDTLRLRYVFASEEYPEYAGKDLGDVLGVFIRPWQSKGCRNFALVPGTGELVSVHTVHPNGERSSSSTCRKRRRR